MSNADIRKAHKLLDYVSQGRAVLDDEIKLLRSFLPELPKQKTLKEVADDVHEAWVASNGDEWVSDGGRSVMSLEDWLRELHEQLQGLKDAGAAILALPAGMRLAEHENFGRVVVSPGVGIDRCHEIFYLDSGMSSGTDISEVEPDSLTFIDTEPAKPIHPEFLETEADYENAPAGTIVAEDGISTSWVKRVDIWASTDGGRGVRCPDFSYGARRVLRWGK